MIGAARRFRAALARCGDSLMIAGVPHLAIVRPISPDGARTFVGDASLATLGRPLMLATVGAEEVVLAGTTIAWAGRTWVLHVVNPIRLAGTLVAQEWILAPT